MNMTMRLQRSADGTTRHVPAPLTLVVRKSARKARPAPDPIRTNGESAAEQLRLLVERVESIDQEIRGAQDDRKDVLAEARSRGYDTRTIVAIVARRRKDSTVLQEEDAMLETYLQSLGLL